MVEHHYTTSFQFSLIEGRVAYCCYIPRAASWFSPLCGFRDCGRFEGLWRCGLLWGVGEKWNCVVSAR
jgi:hypothetical protein